MITIIVPFLNEETLLLPLGENLRGLSGSPELIFVDGGSSDRSVSIARRFGTVLSSPPGRACQMNLAASVATGDILLFLHADCLLPRHALLDIERSLANPVLAGGCLTQVFRVSPSRSVFDWIAFGGNLRARLTRSFFGDQAIFCRRDLFHHLGGYPDIPIFEDLEFSRLLRTAGPTTVLGTPVFCSPRRWLTHGLVRTTLVDWRVHSGRSLGVPFSRLARWYARIDAR